eukprot:Gb_06525 [translate_table: standard]
MGTCISTCKGSVSHSKGTASHSKGTACESPASPSPIKIKLAKEEAVLTECSPNKLQPITPLCSIDPNSSVQTEDKQVVIDETVRDAEARSCNQIRSPGNLLSSLKENQDVNLIQSVKSSKRFTRNSTDETGIAHHSSCKQIPVKRRTHEENQVKRPAQRRTPSREPGESNLRRLEEQKTELAGTEKVPSLRRTAPSPARRIERSRSKRSESAEARLNPKKIPVRQQNLGEPSAGSASLRSRSSTFRVPMGSTSSTSECRDSKGFLRKRNSQLNEEMASAQISEDTHQISENLLRDEPRKMMEDDQKNPQNFREETEDTAQNPSLTEMQSDSTIPPIDMENPLISLDCFIFLLAAALKPLRTSVVHMCDPPQPVCGLTLWGTGVSMPG